MPNYTIKTLEGTSITELTSSFNMAFSDYFIKFELTEASLLNKMIAENIQLEFSVAVFIDEYLVGFILTGIDEFNETKYAYNAGTGVWPAYRGNGFTEKMYQCLISLLNKKSIHHHQLEVMTQNTVALKVYKSIGFVVEETVCCFRGVLNQAEENNSVEIDPIDIPAEEVIRYFRDEYPTWQNSSNAIERTKDQHICLAAKHEGEISGYLIFSPANMRIKQFAVKKEMRKKGIGKALFAKLKTYSGEKEISIINVSRQNTIAISFLEKAGLNIYVEQFLMKMKTSS
ncbi:MAG: GNAT family N-acetyltransferase [Ferruginibacter sp.]